MKLEMIRHGLTRYTEEHRYLGLIDEPLSANGRAALYCRNPGVSKVYVTPLCRTKETAAILYPGAEQVLIEGFEEMDFGEFDGKCFEELSLDNRYQTWVESGCTGFCPHGESKASFSARVTKAFERLMIDAIRNKENEIFIVCHGGTIMAVLDRYAAEKKDYFSWLPPCGSGYLLNADYWEERQELQVICSIH